MADLLKTGDPRAASGRILLAALGQTGSEYGFAGVSDGQTLRILNHEGVVWHDHVNRPFYDEAADRYRRTGSLEFTNFNNLFGQVLMTGRAVIANDPANDSRAGGLPPGHPPLNSFLGVPILNGDQIVGLIGVANRAGGYGACEQDRLEVFAQMAGVIYVTLAHQQRAAELAQQLRHATKMEAIGRLAGGVAHDFNNLLTAISGYTSFVLESFDESDSRRADLLEASKAAERAAALTRQLLALGRRQILQPKVLNMNGLVSGIQKLLQRTIPEHIELVLDLDSALDPVRVDPGQLEQVLLNLALNARDAMPQGGRLCFATKAADIGDAWAKRHPPMTAARYVRLTVSDTGLGMSPDTQSRVFEPFFTTKEHGKGTGLGLATVYGIVKQSGGFIWVSSELGKGTAFEVYLPVVHEPIELASPDEQNTDSGGGSETILLAEDDGAVRRLCRDILTHYGYTVLDARDGDEALAIARRHHGMIHLLITDMVMPGLSGRELAARVTADRPDLRVLYTSGYAETSTMRQVTETRQQRLLTKPFLPMDLLRKVRTTLDAKSSSIV